jgi:hypothetical protein
MPAPRRGCPHLGLRSDPLTHAAGASDEHRCYAGLGQERIDLSHQRRFCLAACHTRCPFLTVEQTGLLERLWAWARAVSPAVQDRVGVPRRPRLPRSPWGSPRSAFSHLAEMRRAPAGVTPAAVTPEPAAVLAVVSREEDAAVEACQPALRSDLVEDGVAALEGGDDAAAYTQFARATKVQPNDVRAWFWRAKTAETLDEVIACLQRAQKLEPTSSQIRASLEWAVRRREQARAPDAPRPIRQPERQPRTSAPASLRAPSPAMKLLQFSLEVTRATTGLAGLLVASTWLLIALPPDMRQSVLTSLGLTAMPLPTLPAASLSLPHLGAYNAASALPYGLAFLAIFVALGVLSAEAWTRLWAPLLGVASAWLWLQAADPSDVPVIPLAACALLTMSILLHLHMPRRKML